jgi:hypothetical protein
MARKELKPSTSTSTINVNVHVDPNLNNRIEGNIFCLNTFRFDRVGVDVTVVVDADGI